MAMGTTSFFRPLDIFEDSLPPHGHADDFTVDAPAMWRDLQYDNEQQNAKEDAVRIDYSVLSVGVMTLGLIMFVELGRHKLDHAARHKSFLKAVLEKVYEELATLGIVEFLMHLMAEYYEQYDKVGA